MKRRFFALLIVLMTTSITGIICLQGYLISDTFYKNENYFSLNANMAITNTIQKVQNQEFINLFNAVQIAGNKLGKNEHILNNICNQDASENILENDDLHQKIRLALDSVVNGVKKDTIGLKNNLKHHKVHSLSSMADYEYSFYQSLIREYTTGLNIEHRVNKHQINHFLKKELDKKDINIDYEFAILNNGLTSSVKTAKFKLDRSKSTVFKASLFENAIRGNNFELVVDFTGKQSFVLESIGLMIILSVILSLIILSTFFYSYRLLKTQRNVSEIKTDFINNMTHELKTPIATINLALDFIRNPKVINDPSMRSTYLDMIDQENKRIHAQVENVLRISKFENREMDMPKRRENLHDLVNSAIAEIQDQIQEYQGELTVNLEASKSYVLANDKYFKVAIINIIDNSLKYSKKAPKINIISENVKNCIILRIKDNGVGIYKKDRKNIFENFFRESTGNLHNVKGYGLGLAYVKQILDDHHGEVIIESEKGKGTEVIIKLPLIS